MAKKNLWFIFVIFALLLLTACAGAGRPAALPPYLSHIPERPDLQRDNPLEPVSGKTAMEYFRDEKILVGWNVGNTLDAHNGGFAGETVWGNPRINQALLDGVKAAGFDILRIPITWMGDIGAPPDYRILQSKLSRVGDVVEMARNAGLKVIINLHHDGATETGGRDLGWLSVSQASRNQVEFNRITSKYVRVWRQIATYFQNYGDWLMFESFNEPHDGNWQSTSDISQIITLNRWNQIFIDIVRSSGGNNGSRFLIVGAYCKDYRQALAPGFMMPSDTAEDRLILSFHYYDPHQFAIAGTRAEWGTEQDRLRVENDFAPFRERFLDKNIPVIIGESGAVLQLHPDNPQREEQARLSRREYISHVFTTAHRHGLVPIFWDNGSTTGGGEKFGLFNRNNGQPNSPESDALIKLMINAVK
jgi:endoglucanase